MISAGIIAAALVAGVLTGLVAGMLGVGGGVIMLPVLRLLFGMSAIQTTATSLFTIIPTSLSGAISHVRGKTCAPKLGIAMGVGGAITSTLGVRLAQISPGWLIMLAAAAAVGYSAFTTLRKALALPKVKSSLEADGVEAAPAEGASEDGMPSESAQAEGTPAGSMPAVDAPRDNTQSIALPAVRVQSDDPLAPSEASACASDAAAIDSSPIAIVKALIIGIITGIISGYIGLGGGFLMVPLMLSLLKMPMKLASGTSLVAIMILAIPATITQFMLGNVQVAVGLAMACGSVPAAALGARFAKRVPERRLRFMFAGFLFLSSISLVLRELIV